jgi:hypothetical protein
MRARRYTVVVADRSSGVVRRVTVSLRPVVLLLVALLAMPVLGNRPIAIVQGRA